MSKKTHKDIINDFIFECCEVAEEARIQTKDLYNAFTDWYVTNISCCRLPNFSSFSREIIKEYEKENTCAGWRYIGLKLKENKEDHRLALAKILMNQIDNSAESSAFWMVSCISKLKSANPQMNLVCLLNIIQKEMPNSFNKYQEYLKNT